MTDSGPTTVGSIVGKLRLDRAQWVAEVAATKSDIRELEGSDPDIHIDVNAAEAIAQLKATGAAADALGAKTEDLGRKTRKATEEMVKANDANKTSVTRVGAIATAVAMLLPLPGHQRSARQDPPRSGHLDARRAPPPRAVSGAPWPRTTPRQHGRDPLAPAPGS